MEASSRRHEFNDTLFGVYLEDTASICAVIGYFDFLA